MFFNKKNAADKRAGRRNMLGWGGKCFGATMPRRHWRHWIESTKERQTRINTTHNEQKVFWVFCKFIPTIANIPTVRCFIHASTSFSSNELSRSLSLSNSVLLPHWDGVQKWHTVQMKITTTIFDVQWDSFNDSIICLKITSYSLRSTIIFLFTLSHSHSYSKWFWSIRTPSLFHSFCSLATNVTSFYFLSFESFFHFIIPFVFRLIDRKHALARMPVTIKLRHSFHFINLDS